MLLGWRGMLLGLSALLCVEQGGLVFAQEKPNVVAIQKRTYSLNDELTVQAGYLPLDVFTKYVAFGGSYTHFFNDYMGWEIINASYASSLPSGLEQELRDRFTVVSDERFDVLNYYGTTNFVFTPFYSKNLLFDSSIVYGETSFVGGMGISKFDSGNINTLDLGIIFRFVLGNASFLKFDIREYIYFAGNAKTNLMLNVGFAYNLGNTVVPGGSSE